MAINASDIADPNGQSRAVVNWFCTRFPTITDLPPPSRSGVRYAPKHGMKTRMKPARIPGEHNGIVTRKASQKAARPDRRSLQQVPIQPLQRPIKRQHHKRQKTINQSQDHRAIVIKQRQRIVNQSDLLKHGIDQSRVPQQEHPGVSPHQKAGPERQHH